MGSCLSTGKSAVANSGRPRSSKREAREVLALEAKNDEQLSCYPGRMCSNGSSTSCSLFSQQGRKGINQDAMIAWEGFASREDTAFCGVFDGHGPYGHLVARRVRDSLPLKLVQEFLNKDSGNHLKNPINGQDEFSDLFTFWKDLHFKAFKTMDRELQVHPSIDCFCSGTTAVTLLKQGEDLFIGNVGDSRAILATTSDDGSITAVPLTVDLKPNLPKEAERIRQCKGRVFALHDEPEVHRVWLPHENSPGLAMARAFGDFCLKEFGVIAVPDVFYRKLTNNDKFVVLATDGVWDVLSNEEVVNIVSSHPTRTTAARSLVESAVQAWMLKYPTSKIDDCAAVCLYLDTIVAVPSQCNHVNVDGEEAVPGEDQPVVEAISVSVPVQDSTAIVPRSDGNNATSEWLALEGITRVNSLLSLPRFLLGDKRLGGSKRRR